MGGSSPISVTRIMYTPLAMQRWTLDPERAEAAWKSLWAWNMAQRRNYRLHSTPFTTELSRVKSTT